LVESFKLIFLFDKNVVYLLLDIDKFMTATTYLLSLPIMVLGYFSFCVIYNLIKTPKRWKVIFYKVKTGNVPATIPVFFWCCLYFYYI
jgi:hypothetical protein